MERVWGGASRMHRGWIMGANDPHPWGWAITIAYLIAATLCFVNAGRLASHNAASVPSSALFWRAAAVILLLLGINKQLDLQTPALHAMRDAAKAGGIYSARGALQWLVVGVAAVSGMTALAWAAMTVKKDRRAGLPAIAGLTLLLVFVVVRASPLRHIDSLMGLDLSWIPDKKHILEMSGIVLVACAALFRLAPSGSGNQSSPCSR
jgi:hypothetical protein